MDESLGIATSNARANHCNEENSRYQLRSIALVVLTVIPSIVGCGGLKQWYQNGFLVGPNYARPCAATAADWIDSSDSKISSGAPNDAAWWQSLNDPVLNGLIEAAYRQNLTLRVAGLRIMEARALRNIAAGNLFPQTQQATGSYTRTNNSKSAPLVSPQLYYDEWQVGTNLAWELDFWGRFRRALESAEATLDASIENYDDVLVLLVSEVAQSYVEIRTAEQRLEYVRKNVETQRQSLDLANVKFANGATTRLDVTQGESTLGQTEAFIPPLDSQRRLAMNQICILLGMPPRDINDLIDGRRPIPSPPPEVALGIPADLLRRRPDIRKAEREVAAQSARIGIAASELYPHLAITGSVCFDTEQFKDLFGSQSFAGNVGPSFTWNILNYGRLVNGVRVEDARFQQLAVAYQNLVLQANAEVENNVVQFLNAQRRVKSLTASTHAAEQSVELVRTQYDAGKTDFNRVLVVEQALALQQDQLAASEGSVAQYLIEIYKALGGGWQIRLGNPNEPEVAAVAQPVDLVAPAPGDVK